MTDDTTGGARSENGAFPKSLFTVDFHTHVFPDALAKRAVATVSENVKGVYTPVSDGTVHGLLRNMKSWGVDVSVSLPVVTNPKHFNTVNEFAAAQNTLIPEIEFFGGLHPATADWKRDIDFIVSLGLKGIKLHPKYQCFTPADPALFPMYDYALSRGLILVFHAGVDPGARPPYKSDPRQFAKIADEMKGGVIVAAHLGGNMQWEEVERDLAGKNIYMDTSTGFSFYGKERFLRIVQKHGADKLLFASDSPWGNAAEEKAQLCSLLNPDDSQGETPRTHESQKPKRGLSLEEITLIVGGNARRILNPA